MIPANCFSLASYHSQQRVTAVLNVEVSHDYSIHVADGEERCNIIALSRLWDLVYGDLSEEISNTLSILNAGDRDVAVAKLKVLKAKLDRQNVLRIIPELKRPVRLTKK